MYRREFQSRLGASASRLNRKSPPPASSSLFRKLRTPKLTALSLNASSSTPNLPLFSGPFLRPSSSQRLLSPDLTNATKCKSILSSADGAVVLPCTAAAACADAMSGDCSSSWARCTGDKGRAWEIKWESEESWPCGIISFWICDGGFKFTNHFPCPAVAD